MLLSWVLVSFFGRAYVQNQLGEKKPVFATIIPIKMELISHLEVHLLELLEVESLVVLDADDELAFLLDSRKKI